MVKILDETSVITPRIGRRGSIRAQSFTSSPGWHVTEGPDDALRGRVHSVFLNMVDYVQVSTTLRPAAGGTDWNAELARSYAYSW